MNNSDLEKKLKSARIPERSEEYWKDFPRQVRAGLNRISGERPVWQHRKRHLARGIGLAFACIVLVIGIAAPLMWHSMPENSEASLQNQKVLREMFAMFPHQVRAIVEDEQGMHLQLSDQADVPNSPPLWVKVCDGRRCFTFVTFSGQQIQVDGERMDVLADAHGGVLLVGEKKVLSSDEVSNGLKVEARALNYNL